MSVRSKDGEAEGTDHERPCREYDNGHRSSPGTSYAHRPGHREHRGTNEDGSEVHHGLAPNRNIHRTHEHAQQAQWNHRKRPPAEHETRNDRDVRATVQARLVRLPHIGHIGVRGAWVKGDGNAPSRAADSMT